MKEKQCSECKETKLLDNFYSQNKYSKKRRYYIYYNPECKECTKERSDEWRKKPENRENFLQSQKRRNKNFILEMRENANKRRKEGKHKEWQQKNKEKLKEYNKYRNMHKSHDISEEEWEHCKEFFDYTCAYCGIDEYFAKEVYKNRLHMDHVDHEGSNDITNCVPAYKSCNSQKWEFKLNEWYNEENEIYSKERYERIVQWLTSFAIKI